MTYYPGTRQIIELDERWLLPLGGQIVARSYAYPGLIFDLEGEGRSYALRMNGDAAFRSKEGSERFIPEERWEEDAPDLIRLFDGKTVEQAFAYKVGMLRIDFEDGDTLEVYPDADYESWELSGTGDLRVIGLPGGKLAIWRAELGA